MIVGNNDVYYERIYSMSERIVKGIYMCAFSGGKSIVNPKQFQLKEYVF